MGVKCVRYTYIYIYYVYIHIYMLCFLVVACTFCTQKNRCCLCSIRKSMCLSYLNCPFRNLLDHQRNENELQRETCRILRLVKTMKNGYYLLVVETSHLPNMLIKLDHFPRVKIQKCLKPPPRYKMMKVRLIQFQCEYTTVFFHIFSPTRLFVAIQFVT